MEFQRSWVRRLLLLTQLPSKLDKIGYETSFGVDFGYSLGWYTENES